jgi:hypothetical protein
MRALKFLILFYFLKSSSTQSVSKCADFKAYEKGNFSELLKGKWFLVRFCGVEKIPDQRRSPCTILNLTPIIEGKEVRSEFLMTEQATLHVNNDTSHVYLRSPGVAEVAEEKQMEHAGLKMKINVHAWVI